jgi:hypothetical protein
MSADLRGRRDASSRWSGGATRHAGERAGIRGWQRKGNEIVSARPCPC